MNDGTDSDDGITRTTKTPGTGLTYIYNLLMKYVYGNTIGVLMSPLNSTKTTAQVGLYIYYIIDVHYISYMLLYINHDRV